MNRLAEAAPSSRRRVVIVPKFQVATGLAHPHRAAAPANQAGLPQARSRTRAETTARFQAMLAEAGLRAHRPRSGVAAPSDLPEGSARRGAGMALTWSPIMTAVRADQRLAPLAACRGTVRVPCRRHRPNFITDQEGWAPMHTDREIRRHRPQPTSHQTARPPPPAPTVRPTHRPSDGKTAPPARRTHQPSNGNAVTTSLQTATPPQCVSTRPSIVPSRALTPTDRCASVPIPSYR
jgi:hypothetical protein